MATDYDAPRKTDEDTDSIQALQERVPDKMSGVVDVDDAGRQDIGVDAEMVRGGQVQCGDRLEEFGLALESRFGWSDAGLATQRHGASHRRLRDLQDDGSDLQSSASPSIFKKRVTVDSYDEVGSEAADVPVQVGS